MAHNDQVLVAHQPAYLPWQGYFARLLDVKRLVLLDHVQFAERGRHHRNWIAGHHDGRQLLSVPILRTGRFGQSIRDAKIADPRWAARHWRTLQQVYGHAAHFDDLADDLHAIYKQPWTTLSDLNTALIEFVLHALDLNVHIEHSSAIAPAGSKTAMLIDLCRRTDTTVLRVGTSAPGYLDSRLLAEAGIAVEIISYTHIPYPQGHRSFVPALAALDLLLHQRPHARRILAAGSAIRTWNSVYSKELR